MSRLGRSRLARALVMVRGARGLVLASVLVVGACGEQREPTGAFRGADSTEAAPASDASGGAMTVRDASSRAFSFPGPTIAGDRLAEFRNGDALFGSTFVPSPALVNGGLGPRFDNTSCRACHTGDGRGRPPLDGEDVRSMILRVSVTGEDAHGGPLGVADVGTQLRLRAAVGFAPHAAVRITYADSAGRFDDGEQYALRVPRYELVAPPGGTLPPGVALSPRVAPPNFGLGLLEAVPEADVLALAMRSDAAAAGVSGHANAVWDRITGRSVIGRFGAKANVATLDEQVAGAAHGDMGLTSPIFPVKACTDAERMALATLGACAPAEGQATDLSAEQVGRLAAYVRSLGVPARRDVTAPAVRRGEQLFRTSGCNGCHVETLRTGTIAEAPERSGQTIHPYTDLLLHDMGAGLADGRADYRANGREWRTPPLWGIGLTALVNGHTNFLHDGRARSLMEAILWHDGQAAESRRRVLALPKGDRDALVAFLSSL